MDLLDGVQVTDSYLIAKKYAKNMFLIDLISSLPWDDLTGV